MNLVAPRGSISGSKFLLAGVIHAIYDDPNSGSKSLASNFLQHGPRAQRLIALSHQIQVWQHLWGSHPLDQTRLMPNPFPLAQARPVSKQQNESPANTSKYPLAVYLTNQQTAEKKSKQQLLNNPAKKQLESSLLSSSQERRRRNPQKQRDVLLKSDKEQTRLQQRCSIELARPAFLIFALTGKTAAWKQSQKLEAKLFRHCGLTYRTWQLPSLMTCQSTSQNEAYEKACFVHHRPSRIPPLLAVGHRRSSLLMYAGEESARGQK